MGKRKNDNFIKAIATIIVKKIDFSNLSNASKINLLFSVIIALVIIALSITPVLSLVEGIVISIGNIFITIFTEKEILVSKSTSNPTNVVIMIVLLIVEMTLCKIFCFKAKYN